MSAYARVRWRLWRGDLTSTLADLRAAGPVTRVSGPDARASALRLTSALGRTLRLIPADSRCLMRSLVMTRLLSRRGIDTTLVLAVRVEDGFGAHAWVEVDGRPVLEPAGAPFRRLAEL